MKNGTKLTSSRQGLMNSDSAAFAAQDIPLHTFRSGLKTTYEDIPLEYLKFSAAPALTQTTYPHRHNFYEVLYVTEGGGTHYIDFNAYPIKPYTFYFISPGQVHYWNTAAPLEGNILVFMDDFLLLAPADYMVLHELSFFHTIEGSPTLQLDEREHSQVASMFSAIEEEFKTYDFRSASVLRAHLHILLVYIQRICANQEAQAGNPQDKVAQKLTRQFKKLITDQIITGHSLQDYAGQLGVSVNHLSKTVKTTTGRTPGQLIRQEIVLEAKRLFQHTELTATEIGYRLGFDDPSYFGRFFKREVGISPGRFRQDSS